MMVDNDIMSLIRPYESASRFENALMGIAAAEADVAAVDDEKPERWATEIGCTVDIVTLSAHPARFVEGCRVTYLDE